MRYSLSSRFRGTLLGAAIGDMIVKYNNSLQPRFSDPESIETHDQKQPLATWRGKKPSHDAPEYCPWGSLAIKGAESLIMLGRFDINAWQDATVNKFYLKKGIKSISPKAIIATLPLALFFHDDHVKLRQNLRQLIAGWHNTIVEDAKGSPTLIDGVLAVGYAIAQALTDKLNPASLIGQTIEFLGEPENQLAQELSQVQTLLEKGAGLEMTVTQLRKNTQLSTDIALAFYCFLTTLEDFRLSVQRSALIARPYSEITSIITGALSGAYNSTVGIPKNWRMVLSQPETKPLTAWGMTTEAEMLELADSLVAVWSGVYDPATHLAAMTPTPAIAAPRVIRCR